MTITLREWEGEEKYFLIDSNWTLQCEWLNDWRFHQFQLETIKNNLQKYQQTLLLSEYKKKNFHIWIFITFHSSFHHRPAFSIECVFKFVVKASKNYYYYFFFCCRYRFLKIKMKQIKNKFIQNICIWPLFYCLRGV